MIVALVSLVLLNVATMLVAARREARLLDALMTRTPQEYIAAKKADAKQQDKPKPRPDASPDDAPPELVFPIGM
jgi:hypothetical protein